MIGLLRATAMVALAAPPAADGLQVVQRVHRINRRSAAITSTSLNLLKGLVTTVDDEIAKANADADLSSLELLNREMESGSSIIDAIKAVSRRNKDKNGDYENKWKILSDYRSYGNEDLLDADHTNVAPTLDDLNQRQPDRSRIFWVTAPFRVFVFAASVAVFPALCHLLERLVDVTEDQIDLINDQFTPAIGVLYGTFVALTLDILYERQGKVQENASVEASLLSQVTQNVINLFRDEMAIAREATQIIADQVRIIVYRSRGSEMLSIMRADPYARLLSIVDHYQRDSTSFTPQQEALIDGLRSEIPELMEARAKRLSDEASALPPTHFFVLSVLTFASLVGFTAATLTITDDNGNPPLESRLVFAGLNAVYVLFYNFCSDMNDPFDGVYQIKRSSAAAYLMQIKWLIANQPYGEKVKFDTTGLAPEFDGNEVYEIGKGATKVEQAKPSDAVVTYAKSETSSPSVMAPTPGPAVATLKETTVVTDYIPNRASKKILSQGQNEASQEEMMNQFQSLGGFGGEESASGPAVTVPRKNTQNGATNRQEISMQYFRKAGGFGGE